MKLRNMIWAGLGVLGLTVAGFSVSSPANAQDLSKMSFAELGAGAPSNGVVMTQDSQFVYIYDAGKDRALMISKNERTSESDVADAPLVPRVFMINPKTGIVSTFKSK